MTHKISPELDINFNELRKQKELLLKLIDNGGDHNLNGIVHLIDSIQDYAVDVEKINENEVYLFE